MTDAKPYTRAEMEQESYGPDDFHPERVAATVDRVAELEKDLRDMTLDRDSWLNQRTLMFESAVDFKARLDISQADAAALRKRVAELEDYQDGDD